MIKKYFFTIVSSLLFLVAPSQPNPDQASTRGSLFIIGGGAIPPQLVQEMIGLSGLDSSSYILILPMASEEPDSSVYYAKKRFVDQGATKVVSVNTFQPYDTNALSDLVMGASIIYLTGGDQVRLMKASKESGLDTLLMKAYQQGAMIAGTSAGAAVQSKRMITGNQKKHPVYTGDFPSIEADNIILDNGLGFTDRIIVDQHFIKRQRLNRLVAVVLENTELIGVGIDESTAIHVIGDSAKVYGQSQVVVIKGNGKEAVVREGLLGGSGLELSVYLPGDSFWLR